MKMICTKPFEFMEISHYEGNPVFPCCPGWLNKSVGKLSENSLADLWYGDEYTKIRKSVIDGSFKYCDKGLCPYLKNETARQDPNSALKMVDEEELTRYQNYVRSPLNFLPQVKVINFAYDKSCNLSCPSCRTSIIQSSKESRLEHSRLAHEVISQLSKRDSTILYITGSGDPFGSRHYWDFLKSDILRENSNLKLLLHTNATLFTKNHWDKISHLKDRILQFEVSADGGSKESYEENRRPAKWEQFIRGVDVIFEAIQESPNIRLQFNYVVQRNNWREIETFYQFAKARWRPNLIRFSSLGDWGTFTNDAYSNRAVHLPQHIEYHQLKEWYLKSNLPLKNDISFDFDFKG